MQRLLVFLFLTFISVGAWAQERPLRIAFYSFTHHTSVSDANERHPMVQLEYQRQWTGGVFLNSHQKWSWYAARRFQSQWPARPFIEMGLVTGYESTPVRSMRIGVEINDHIDLVVMPGFSDRRGLKIHDPISVIGLIIKF